MPQLEYRQSSSSGVDARWGQGMEQFGFWYVDDAVKQWRSQNKLPQIITPDALATAPAKALALLRDVAYMQQAEGLAVDPKSEPTRQLAEMGLGRVGDIITEPEDNGKTTNYIVPIESNAGGQVHLVVNPAWGVHWKLSSDHPLVKDYPQLSMTHHPDDSTPPEIKKNVWGYNPYLAPEVLAQATENMFDVKAFAHDLHDFSAALLNMPETAAYSGHWSLGLMHDSETVALNLGLDISGVHTGLALHLGQEMGVKRACVFGFTTPEATGPEADLARKGYELNKRWNMLHAFTSDRI